MTVENLPAARLMIERRICNQNIAKGLNSISG